MRRRLPVLVCVLALTAAAQAQPVAHAADAHHHFGRQVRFVGIHPIPKAEGGGICNIEGPHVHIYAAGKLEYRDHGGDAYFVGDPVAYKYDGPKYAYKGPHPIHVDAIVGGDPDVEYCYLEGPHFHYFQPAPSDEADFKVVGDAYFYVGAPPQVFLDARPTYVGINAEYRPYVYARPVVEVQAPVGWIGARAEFVTPTVVVETPGIYVEEHGHGRGRGHGEVFVGGGAVVGGGVDVRLFVPPPPSIHIGVGVGIGGGGEFRGGRDRDDDEGEHHGGGHHGRH
jgi:hypothetical protein